MSGVKKGRLFAAIFLVVAAILALAVYLLPVFAMKQVDFEGNNFISSADLQNAAKPYVGESIFWVYFGGGLRRHLLASFGQIKTLDCRLTSLGRLQFQIQEKTPWLSFFSENRNTLIAEDGAILSRGDDGARIPHFEELTIVRGVDNSFFSRSYIHPFLLAEIHKVVTEVKSRLPALALQVQLKDLSVDEDGISVGELILFKNDTLPIYLGALTDLDEKFRALQLFFAQCPPERQALLRYVDARVLGRVTTDASPEIKKQPSKVTGAKTRIRRTRTRHR